MFRCRVNLLDDTRIERDLEKNAVGQVLFDQVCDHLNLLERGYFGLAAVDASNNKVWLDFSREVHKQIIAHDATFTFNVKFYPPDPSLLAEDLTRYLLCLQVRADIMSNRLPCPDDTLAVLGSYTVQSEFGDYDPDVHGPGYLRTIPLAPNQTPELEECVAELHRSYKSMTVAQADENFLQIAMALPLYGVDLHPAKDVHGADVKLGVCADEIIVFEGNTKKHSFPWPRVLKMSYIRNKFHLRIRHTQEDTSESTITYILPSYRASKRLWKFAVEHHAFFRNHRQDKYEGLLQLGSRFRFRRNTHTETLQASSNIKRSAPPVAHTAIKKKEPTYTYQENVDSKVDTKTHKHRHKVIKTAADKSVFEEEEDDDDDEIPEEEQEWFQLLGTRSFPKKVSLLSDSEKLERALPQFWKHSSDDWMILLYPKASETSLWEQEMTPRALPPPEAAELKEEYVKEHFEEITSEESIKTVKIRKSVQFVIEGGGELQKIEELEEGDEEGLQKVVIKKLKAQEVETFEGQTEEGSFGRRTNRVEIVEKIQKMVTEESQKAPEERAKGLEKILLEVEAIGQRLQDVEDLKASLQEVEILEQQVRKQQEELLQEERDAWYILLDRRPGLRELVKRRESMKPLEEEPPKKVSPIHTRDVWHILLERLPRSEWATHLPRAPSVEELIKTPEAAAEEARKWQEEIRLREERRRSSQIRITTQYIFPEGRGVQPERDEKDDWFTLLDTAPKDLALSKALEVFEEVREEKVRLVEEQMSFIKMEMPFEMVQRSPEELQESDRWFLLLDPVPFQKRGVPLDIREIKMKEEQAWRVKEEARKRSQAGLAEEFGVPTTVRIEGQRRTVEEKRVQLLPVREAITEEDIYDDWFILFDKSLKVPVDKAYEDTEDLRIQRRITVVSEQVTIREKDVTIEVKPTIIKEKEEKVEVFEKVAAIDLQGIDDNWFVLLDPTPYALRSVPAEVSDSWFVEERRLKQVQERKIREEEKRKREAEERRARMAVWKEAEPEMEEGEDWFILLQPASKISVDKRAEQERLRKEEEEWMKRVEEKRKQRRVVLRDVKDEWFLLLDASLKDFEFPPPLPSPVISPVVVPKPRPEPKVRPEPKPRPEPIPHTVPKPRPEPKLRPMPPADQPLTSTPTTQAILITRPNYQDESLKRLDITQESEEEQESVLIRKRMMKRMEGESIYVRHSILMLEDSDVTQEVLLKHHASMSELKRIFMEDIPVSCPTEWEKRLSTYNPMSLPQITSSQFLVMDTVETETVVITKVEEEESSM
ncbi:protein 4.1b [Hoplias malabaricus]|uniref:protein 4.1b n=1 Tax=Hoplias malabaricus TaxID=27720 RepID=UPI0034627580